MRSPRICIHTTGNYSGLNTRLHLQFFELGSPRAQVEFGPPSQAIATWHAMMTASMPRRVNPGFATGSGVLFNNEKGYFWCLSYDYLNKYAPNSVLRVR